MLFDDLLAGFTHTRYVNAEGNVPKRPDPPRPQTGILDLWFIRLSLGFRIQFPSIIVRRSTYESLGGFYPERKFSFDWRSKMTTLSKYFLNISAETIPIGPDPIITKLLSFFIAISPYLINIFLHDYYILL